MFGKKALDGVVESVRYDVDGKVKWVRMYKRRGPTYSDWMLVKRSDLIEMLKAGKQVRVGERVEFQASTFKTGPALNVIERGGKEVLVIGDVQGDADRLEGVPVV